MSEKELQIKEVEVQKLEVLPGQVLMVTVKNDDISQDSLAELKTMLATLFPDNQVMVFGMGTSGDVKFALVNEPKISYCTDCACGKKERAEALRE
jgi:hypothetical protein